MPIVSKCSQCGRGYTAPVSSCQICGGACVPVSAGDASLIVPHDESTPEPESPKVECPCCGDAPGPHTITQQTRHLKSVSLIPAKRTYLVTEVKVPGVCGSCHRSLQRKRLLADLLTPLPLPLLFGLLVAIDSPVALAPVLLYLIYVAGRLTYTWADFLLYGSALSWQLTAYVPKADRESTPRYPSGVLHGIVRIAFLPALLAVIAIPIQLGLVQRPHSRRDATEVATAPEKPVAVPAAKAVAAVPAVEPELTPHQQALRFFNLAQSIAVPVTSATLSRSKLGRFATSAEVIAGKKVTVLKVYADESNVPPNTSYQLLNGATLLVNYNTVSSDGLSVVDRQIFLPPREVSELVGQVSSATAHPSEIKIRP